MTARKTHKRKMSRAKARKKPRKAASPGASLRVMTTSPARLVRRSGRLELQIISDLKNVDASVRATLARLASGGNCPTGGHCKTIWVGTTISCESLDCQAPCECHVWGAPAGEDLQDLKKGRIDDAREGWLYQCYCTDVVQA